MGSGCNEIEDSGGSAVSNAYGLAIDLLYADNLNHKIYGVGVFRAKTSPFAEVAHKKMVLFITGHSETGFEGYVTDCTLRRVQIVIIKPNTEAAA